MREIDWLKIKLTNFIGSFFSDVVGLDGEEERCLCIPLDKNFLKPTKRGDVYVSCFVVPTKLAHQEGFTHYIQMKTSLSNAQKLYELGYERLPYLGNLKRGAYGMKKKESKRYDSRVKVIVDNE